MSADYETGVEYSTPPSGGGGGGAVGSVFGRTGDVTATAGDYAASEVDNDSGVAGATVADALDQLDADIAAVPGGDVDGPASATDNAVARFDGTGGKTLQNSSVTIDDSNNVAGVANFTCTGNIVLSTGGATVDGVDLTALATTVSGKAAAAWTVRTVSGTSDTTLSADLNNVVIYTNAGAVSVSVPSGLPLGSYPVFVNGGASTQVTFAGSGGLTLIPPPGMTLKSRTGASGAALCVCVTGTNEAFLTGDVAVV